MQSSLNSQRKAWWVAVEGAWVAIHRNAELEEGILCSTSLLTAIQCDLLASSLSPCLALYYSKNILWHLVQHLNFCLCCILFLLKALLPCTYYHKAHSNVAVVLIFSPCSQHIPILSIRVPQKYLARNNFWDVFENLRTDTFSLILKYTFF